MVIRKGISEGEGEIVVRGNLISGTVDEFREAMLAEVGSGHEQINLDLENVMVVNSAALEVILLGRKKALDMGKKLKIVRCSKELSKTLVSLCFDSILEMPKQQ